MRLDNEALAYLEQRLAATHRHYDGLLGALGRRLDEADERHRQLERELVRHVQELVQRIDLVLLEANRERLSLAHALEDVRARLGAARAGAAAQAMKSVVVCAAQAPFVTGGAEILVRELAAQLARPRLPVDVVALPFHAHPPSEVVRQALAWRLLELRHTDGRAPDLVIPTKFPSYLVAHPNKVAWLFHQYREAYDLLRHGPLCARRLGAGPRAARRRARARCRGARRVPAAVHHLAQRVVAPRALQRAAFGALYPPPPHLAATAARATATTCSGPGG